MPMGKQWVMVADRTRARIFETDGDLDKLNEIEDLMNPEGRFDLSGFFKPISLRGTGSVG
jgi:hypothetical protein